MEFIPDIKPATIILHTDDVERLMQFGYSSSWKRSRGTLLELFQYCQTGTGTTMPG